MSLTDNLMLFLEEQDEKEFVPVIGEEEADEEAIAKRFKIQTKSQADYYVRKVKEIQLEEAEIEAIALKQLERLKSNIDEWKQKELGKLEYPKQFFTNLLQAYAEETLQDSKKRTLSLPNGSIGFKKQHPEYIYDDKVLSEYFAGTTYAHEEIKIKVDKKELKKVLSVVDGRAYIEGELIPGVEVHERDVKFEIK